MSLRLRLTGLFVLLSAAAVAGFALFAYIIASQRIYANFDEALSARADAMVGVLRPIDAPLSDTSAAGHRRQLGFVAGGGLTFQLRDANGQTLYASPGSALRTGIRVPAAGITDETFVTQRAGGQRLRVLSEPIRDDNGMVAGTLQIEQRLNEVDEALDQIRYVFIVVGVGALGIASLLGYVLAGRALAPVREASALARDIEETGNYRRRLPVPSGRGEIGELASTLNAMIARVEHTLNSQRLFLSDSSHELRRPLTVLRANIDVLNNPDTSEEDRKTCLAELAVDANTMSRLVSDLLLLSRDAPQTIEHVPVDVGRLCGDVAARFRVRDSQHELSVDVTPHVFVLGDPERLDDVLRNLLDNAAQYTPERGSIALHLTRNNGSARIEVEDTGIGIPDEERPRLFERFFRGQRARSLRPDGTGLGLAIVKHIVEAHGGTITIDSQPRQGTSFRIDLPALS